MNFKHFMENNNDEQLIVSAISKYFGQKFQKSYDSGFHFWNVYYLGRKIQIIRDGDNIIRIDYEWDDNRERKYGNNNTVQNDSLMFMKSIKSFMKEISGQFCIKAEPYDDNQARVYPMIMKSIGLQKSGNYYCRDMSMLDRKPQMQPKKSTWDGTGQPSEEDLL